MNVQAWIWFQNSSFDFRNANFPHIIKWNLLPSLSLSFLKWVMWAKIRTFYEVLTVHSHLHGVLNCRVWQIWILSSAHQNLFMITFLWSVAQHRNIHRLKSKRKWFKQYVWRGQPIIYSPVRSTKWFFGCPKKLPYFGRLMPINHRRVKGL